MMLVFLAVFFNIERLDYGEQSLIDIHTFVYVLATILILSTLLIRPLQRLPVHFAFVLWLGIYLALKLTLFHSRPLIGGMYTYLSVTEAAMMTIAMLLTVNLSRSLNELEGLAEKTIFPRRNRRIKDLLEAEESIKNELLRSRRHNRPLSVLIVEMEGLTPKKIIEQGSTNAQQLMMNRFLLASLGQELAKVVRRTDLILEPDEQNGFILLCPETTSAGARLLASRIQEIAQMELSITVQCGTASFPDDAVTVEDLLQKARLDMLGAKNLSKVSVTGLVTVDHSKD
jgi:GGDEF domain-containing protein